jgi:hypothetical protein
LGTAKKMRKKQNTRRDVPADIHKIYEAGIMVIGGFMLGCDSEKDNVAHATTEVVTDSAIAIAMVGLLCALANTQHLRRLTAEGELWPILGDAA